MDRLGEMGFLVPLCSLHCLKIRGSIDGPKRCSLRSGDSGFFLSVRAGGRGRPGVRRGNAGASGAVSLSLRRRHRLSPVTNRQEGLCRAGREEVALKQPPQCWGTGWWASSRVLAAGEGCALAGESCGPVSPAFCQPRFDGPSFQAKPALLRSR